MAELNVKIATHHEMENDFERLAERIAEGEEIYTWTVRTNDCSEDLYSGSYDQAAGMAIYWAREEKRLSGNTRITGIALVDLGPNGSARYTRNFIPLEEL